MDEMAIKVGVYFCKHRRSQALCSAMMRGIKVAGDVPIAVQEEDYRYPEFHIAVFYGLSGNLRSLFRDYQKAGKKAVCIDLGYWGRRDGQGRYSGYHKIAVNARHPTEYFQKWKHSSDRLERLGIRVGPWVQGKRNILLAGMSAKSADVEGYKAEEWERDAIKLIRSVSDRPIVYRPKPSWRDAKPIEGTRFSPREEPLEGILHECHAVVTHHSNVAVDGLVTGIPAFCEMGVAKAMGVSDIRQIEKPIYPDGRVQWMCDIAYTQWNVDEMARGKPWKQLKDEGII